MRPFAKADLRFHTLACLLALLLFTRSGPLFAQTVDQDFQFASGLIKLGFPDFAEKALDDMEKRHPGEKERIKLVRAEVLISRRRFAQAEELVKTMPSDSPKADAVKLALAQGYLRYGEKEKSDALYNQFFDKYKNRTPTDPDLLRFFQEALYQRVQLQESNNDLAGAARSYEQLLKTNLGTDAKRRVQIELSEALIRQAEKSPGNKDALLDQAWKLCEALQWGGYDLWFGRSISTMAHIKELKGDKDGAIDLLKGYMKDLKSIDKLLVDAGVPRSLSPMAEARYLRGKLLRERAAAKLKQDKEAGKKLLVQSLVEFENVFSKYPQSDWGPPAGLQSTEIKQQLADMGVRFKIKGKEKHQRAASKAVFNAANNLYRQKEYGRAIDEYIRVLNLQPDGPFSADAVGKLMRCYAELEKSDLLSVRLMAAYLAERFAGRNDAANHLLRLGKFYFDKQMPELYLMAYDAYIRHFPKHPKAAQIVYTLVSLSDKVGDKERSQQYLDHLVKNYPKDKFFLKAIRKSGLDHYQANRYPAAIADLQKYLEISQPGLEKAQAQFFIADSHFRLRQYRKSLAAHTKLVSWLAKEENNPFRGGKREDQVLSLLEKSAFFRGMCYFRLQEPKSESSALREKAVRAFALFIRLFPKSDLGAKALRAQGAIQLELGQTDAAAKTFDQLASQYPDSEEGKNAFYYLVSSAIEVKQYDQAKKAFDSMLTNKGNFTHEQFAQIGQLMVNAGFHARAQKAFAEVIGKTEDRAILERALFYTGNSLAMQKQYDEAAKALEDLMKRYPNSAFFYQAKFLQGEIYRETERYKEATDALSDVFRYSPDKVLNTRASLELGKIQERQELLKEALASYLRIALLADAADQEIRDFVEEAVLSGIRVATGLERWEDVVDLCEQHLKDFPDSDKINEIRNTRNKARLKLQTAPQPAGP